MRGGKSVCHFKGAAFRLKVGLCAKKPKLTRKVTRKCHIKKVAHCEYQNKCCSIIETCRGKRCSTKKNCAFRGAKVKKCHKPTIKVTYHTKCKILSFRKCQNRLNCCETKTTRRGSVKCSKKKACSWRGDVKVITTGSCKIKKHRPVLATPKHCSIYADPHCTPFDNAVFNNQVPGDWVLYEGENLSAHYRGVYHYGWVGWVGPTRFGIKLFNVRIFTTGFNFEHLVVDHKKISIANGKTQIGQGYVTKNGNTLIFSTGMGEDLTIQSLYWNQVWDIKKKMHGLKLMITSLMLG